MMRRTPWSAAALLLATVGLASAADQAILGRRFTLRDPRPGIDATRRSLLALGKETGSIAALVGDPAQNTGGTVAVFVNGGSWTSETYSVPQGIDPGSGRAFWRAIPSGFIYKDPDGTNGPVQAMRIRRSSTGTFELKIVAKGGVGPIGLLPPNPGATACVRFDIGGGDSYHVLWPPEPSVTMGRNDDRTFAMRDALVRGLCPTLPTTTTPTLASTTSTTSSTTTSTNPTAVCGNGVREPGEECDGGFGCTAGCLQEMPSCCSLPDPQCISTPTFSLNFYLMQYCMAFLPGSQPIQGGICAPDGSCAPQPIDPVPVCCQPQPGFGPCYGATVASTNGLWSFQNVCRGAQSGTVFVAADCVAGVCLPQ
jgi:hypothetical protein